VLEVAETLQAGDGDQGEIEEAIDLYRGIPSGSEVFAKAQRNLLLAKSNAGRAARDDSAQRTFRCGWAAMGAIVPARTAGIECRVQQSGTAAG
jgi:hypothetical protein